MKTGKRYGRCWEDQYIFHDTRPITEVQPAKRNHVEFLYSGHIVHKPNLREIRKYVRLHRGKLRRNLKYNEVVHFGKQDFIPALDFPRARKAIEVVKETNRFVQKVFRGEQVLVDLSSGDIYQKT